MIDIVAEETTCKACGKSLIQAKRQGPHKRKYCNDTCRQRAHRAKKQQKRETPEARIATLEMEIAALEVEIRRLQERLNVEQRFRTDTQVRHFKSWLRRNAQPRDTDFFKRFQADTRLPQHTSRSRYAAFLHLYHYSEEDIYLFEEAWKDMMFLQS